MRVERKKCCVNNHLLSREWKGLEPKEEPANGDVYAD